MEQVRCTNCGSTAILPEGSGEFCKCEACGSTFSVARAANFGSVQLDHTQDIRAWREYLAKQLRLQQDSNKARDYAGVKLFAQKILSVLPDDFRAQYYVSLSERYADNDTAYTEFLRSVDFDGVTREELKEVTGSLVATVEPKYADNVRAFIKRAFPQNFKSFEPLLERNLKAYIQRLQYVRATDRDVFICHRTAEPDQDIADAICTRLEERGLRCWIAPRNILAGSQNYERDILKGVENSRLFLLVSSFKSIYSEDCEKELKAAVLAGKALYSYKIDDTPYDGAFDKALGDVQWLDATDDPYAYLEQLVIDIKGLLARDEREKAELEEKRLAAREKERLSAEARRSKDNERIDRLERIISGELAATSAAVSYSLRPRLKRAEIEVQSQNYDRAEHIIDEILDADPECAQAWWLLMLCEYRLPDDESLIKSGRDFTAHRYFRNAARFSDDEPYFAERLERATSDFRTRSLKDVTHYLDEAERLFEVDNFKAMNDMLDKCKDVFADESSIVYKKFADIASRYYWLKLWAKYGQSYLVCVEDITRETEYKNALKYASPAQAARYAKERETVSKNALMFLRERSKNRANDGKLTDYLVDNKNILSVDSYNYYSSLLYYRKMLSTLNMTENQLRASTVDISTNEYFMLAQSMATAGQKRMYDELSATLDRNRAEKQRRAAERKSAVSVRAAAISAGNKAGAAIASVFVGIFAAISYLLFIVGTVNLYEAETCVGCYIASAVLRLITAAIAFKYKNKGLIAVTSVNIMLSIISTVITIVVTAIDFEFELLPVSICMLVFSFAATILEITYLSKHSKK